MEHRLIRGGERFLPFARSIVTKLKKLGLPYASQSVEVGGAKIEVRIVPGQEFIRIDEVTGAYMESGQLEFFAPVPDHPERLKPAKWHFLDIPADGKYLGKIFTSEKKVGDQNNAPELSEGMDSLAIGYPKVIEAEPNLAAKIAKNVATEAEYEGATIAKKLVVGYFQASLFTGKMRLFMQAQYGAAESTGFSPLYLDLLGTEVILMYLGKEGRDADGNTVPAVAIQFGFWPHNTPFIFTDAKGRYWLMVMTNPTNSNFVLTAYPIKANYSMFSSAKETTDPEEPRKREAYIMASAVIETNKPVVVGEFGDESGGAMAYGWKANSDGSEAAIVLHKNLGTDDHDNRWRSTTIKCAITCDIAENGDRTFAAEFTKTVNGEWQDGWGEYNIFVPGDGHTYLESFSIVMNIAGAAPRFDFPDTEVYGYYKDDVWLSVKVSRSTPPGPWPKYTQYCSMPYRDPGIADTVTNRFYYDTHIGGEPWDYWSESRTSSVTMDLKVGATTYAGESWYGQKYVVEHTSVTTSLAQGGIDYLPMILPMTSGLTFDPVAVYGPPFDGSYPPGESGSIHFSEEVATWTTNEWLSTGWSFHQWTLVIPCHDCEAAFAGTHQYEAPETMNLSTTVTPGVRIGHYHSSGTGGRAYVGYAATTLETVVTVRPDTPQILAAQIYCHNQALVGEQGNYHASSTPLFQVDYNHPYYMANMTSLTSDGKRYIVSEGLKSPESVNDQHRFVGWA